MTSQKEKAKRKVTWSSEGQHAAQLFRDIFFEKYPKGTKPSEVYEDLDRPYHNYNKDGFYKQYKKFVEKVETFRSFGTGLKPDFRKLCKLDQPPPPEERGSKIPDVPKDEEEEDEDDEDFVPDEAEEEEDEDNNNDDDEVVSVQVLSRKSKKETHLQTPCKPPGEVFVMPRASAKKDAFGDCNIPLFSPQLTECPGGILAGYTPLHNGVEYDFTISDDGKEIIQKLYIPEEFEDAQKIFSRHGLNKYNVYIRSVQDMIDKQKKLAKTTDLGKLYHESVLFHLPYEIEKCFYDDKGGQVNAIFEGKTINGLTWIFFYLKKLVVQEVKAKKATIERELGVQSPIEVAIQQIKEQQITLAKERELQNTQQERLNSEAIKFRDEEKKLKHAYDVRFDQQMQERTKELENMFQQRLQMREQQMQNEIEVIANQAAAMSPNSFHTVNQGLSGDPVVQQMSQQVHFQSPPSRLIAALNDPQPDHIPSQTTMAMRRFLGLVPGVPQRPPEHVNLADNASNDAESVMTDSPGSDLEL